MLTEESDMRAGAKSAGHRAKPDEPGLLLFILVILLTVFICMV